MSITLIVVISAVMAFLIGLKIYLENKEEQQVKEEVKQDSFKDAHTIVINPVDSTVTTVETPAPTLVDVESTNAVVAVVEEKPKKKKRYYVKKKPSAKPTTKKQTKK